MRLDETYRWHGMDTAEAIRATGASHVGGLSAAISYGWTSAVEHAITVYGAGSDVADEVQLDNVRVRCVRPTVPFDPVLGLSLRRDGSGAEFPTSDLLRAVVECLLDDEVLDVDDWREILRGAERMEIEPHEVVGYAKMLCPAAANIVCERLNSL